MVTLRFASRAALLAVALFAAGSCSDGPQAPLTDPSFSIGQQQRDIHAAIAVQERHTAALLRIPGVVGTAVGLLPSGRPAIRVFVARPDARGIPTALDAVPVEVVVSGQFHARSDPTTRQRPAPLGYSVGHPAITAGTIGARVVDAAGNVYILSNNHVLANSNGAAVGDATYQPGPYDGGTAADQIGTLAAFRPIDFSLTGQNPMDAAIARVAPADLGTATPTDDGYGAPNPVIFGDANGDGAFDDEAALLGLAVQKYGRTTRLTHGSITAINATVQVCYASFFGFCIQSAYFVDQLIVEPGAFSGGGDSGSLIVTDDANHHPVALLFAGSTTQTIANRIDLVLAHFGVAIDGGEPPPPPEPLTDVGLTGVSAPASVSQGSTVNVAVTLRNTGNQDVTSPITVTLNDDTDGALIGSQHVAGLAVGATATLTFPWSTSATTTLGTHTLRAAHDFSDENTANDQRSTTTTVSTPGPAGPLHIGDLDGMNSDDGTTWSAIVEITVHDANHQPVDGATVTGKWNRQGLNANTCTTAELGGDGTCIVLFPSLKRSVRFVTYTVTGVTMAGVSYDATRNHDVDGGTDGTAARVNRP
jgi:hypothetical protein